MIGNSEKWKDIPNYEGIYYVSSFGNVKRKYKNGNIKLLKLQEDKDGYYYVILSLNNVKVHKRINRLVLEAFDNSGNRDNLQVNHKDGNKTNNKLENLEWATQKENLQHAFKNNLIKTKKVKCLDTGKVYNSIREAGRKTNSNFRKISECCLGKRKKTNNLTWEYYE